LFPLADTLLSCKGQALILEEKKDAFPNEFCTFSLAIPPFYWLKSWKESHIQRAGPKTEKSLNAAVCWQYMFAAQNVWVIENGRPKSLEMPLSEVFCKACQNDKATPKIISLAHRARYWAHSSVM